MRIQTHKHTNNTTYAHTHIGTHTHTHIRTYAHTHIHTYAHTHIRTYAHTHIRTYAHMHICTYAHTHIRRYAQALRSQPRALPDGAKSFDNFRTTTEDKLLFSVLPENEKSGWPERPFLPRRKKIFFCNKFRERTGRLIGSGGQRPERKSFRW